MKKIFLIVFCFLSYNLTFAQNKSGLVEYEIAAVDVPFKEGNSQNDMVKNLIEIAKSQKFELKFNSTLSSFSQIVPLDNEQYDEDLINLAKIAYTTTDSYFLDFAKKELLTKTADNTLLKSKSINTEWKILTETKKIDNYLCYKAEYRYMIINRLGKEKEIVITAWFAPSLPFPFGPIEFHGLPGLILELNQNYTTYLAKKITLSDLALKIDFPKGKTITKEEYEQKVLSGN